LKVKGLGFRGDEFGVDGSGFRVWGFGFGFGFGVWGLEFRVWGSGFRV